MKNLKKYIIIAILASVIIYLSGCASLTYNPHSQTEKVKVTLKNNNCIISVYATCKSHIYNIDALPVYIWC